MPDFGIFRGFNDKLFGNKLYAGQLPTQLGNITFSGLLDFYPNAAAAYSIRLLRRDYTGSAIRVRRSSDNTEQDIGFVNYVLDTSSLMSFCGIGNGFVTTWYDQSGNGRNATQTTAANQPQIVVGGTMITENSKPSIQFDSSDSLRTITTLSLNNSNISIFNIVKQSTNLDNAGIIILTPSSGNDYDQLDGLVIETGNASNQFAMINNLSVLNLEEVGTGPTTYALRTAIKTTSYAEIRKNGTLSRSVTRIINSGISNSILLGQRFLSGSVSNSYGLSGIMQEIIFYASNESSNRTGIESNINSYYAIY